MDFSPVSTKRRAAFDNFSPVYPVSKSSDTFEILMANSLLQFSNDLNNNNQPSPCTYCHQINTVVPCAFCSKLCCDSCCKMCERCLEVFCLVCSTINYDLPRYDRIFCLECNWQEQKSRRDSRQASLSLSNQRVGFKPPFYF